MFSVNAYINGRTTVTFGASEYNIYVLVSDANHDLDVETVGAIEFTWVAAPATPQRITQGHWVANLRVDDYDGPWLAGSDQGMHDSYCPAMQDIYTYGGVVPGWRNDADLPTNALGDIAEEFLSHLEGLRYLWTTMPSRTPPDAIAPDA